MCDGLWDILRLGIEVVCLFTFLAAHCTAKLLPVCMGQAKYNANNYYFFSGKNEKKSPQVVIEET